MPGSPDLPTPPQPKTPETPSEPTGLLDRLKIKQKEAMDELNAGVILKDPKDMLAEADAFAPLKEPEFVDELKKHLAERQKDVDKGMTDETASYKHGIDSLGNPVLPQTKTPRFQSTGSAAQSPAPAANRRFGRAAFKGGDLDNLGSTSKYKDSLTPRSKQVVNAPSDPTRKATTSDKYNTGSYQGKEAADREWEQKHPPKQFSKLKGY